MKQMIGFLRHYYKEVNKPVLYATTLLVALMICFNYLSGLERQIAREGSFPLRFSGFYLLYAFIFFASYLINFKLDKGSKPVDVYFYILLIFSPAFFAWKVSSGLVGSSMSALFEYPWNKYWAVILSLPIKYAVVFAIVFIIKKAGRYKQALPRLATVKVDYKPFLLIVCIFIPIIFIAASQHGFADTYPKLKTVSFALPYSSQPWITSIIYELSYGFDFLITETFFRGLLIFAFVRYVGPAAILPMAAFYSAIHFGKPLVECISSYFGGIFLGVIALRTGSIRGGLIIHLGIGWMMEIAGVFRIK
jgi:hypothetical protein